MNAACAGSGAGDDSRELDAAAGAPDADADLGGDTDEVYERAGIRGCTGPVDPFEAWTWELVDPSEFGAIGEIELR